MKIVTKIAIGFAISTGLSAVAIMTAPWPRDPSRVMKPDIVAQLFSRRPHGKTYSRL